MANVLRIFLSFVLAYFHIVISATVHFHSSAAVLGAILFRFSCASKRFRKLQKKNNCSHERNKSLEIQRLRRKFTNICKLISVIRAMVILCSCDTDLFDCLTSRKHTI